MMYVLHGAWFMVPAHHWFIWTMDGYFIGGMN